MNSESWRDINENSYVDLFVNISWIDVMTVKRLPMSTIVIDFNYSL